MFKRDSNEGLTLELEGENFRFKDTRALEFALAGRTSLPPAKFASLMEQTDAALLREAEGIRAVEQRFTDALSGMLEDVTSISPFLKELDMALISQDHGWRVIMTALNGTNRTFEEYKKVALVKYIQYLSARQEVIKNLFAQRQAQKRTSAEPPLPPVTSAHDVPPDKFRDTLIFDVSDKSKDDSLYGSFNRLPKGEVVEFSIGADEEVEILMAQHRCCIAHKGELVFFDERGQDSVLTPGKNIVGRDTSCDIIIDPALRDISRKHLVVELADNVIRLTDLSSHGTSIPPGLLDITSV